MAEAADDTRMGIFGWGLVAPRSPDIQTFERNLSARKSWLTTFDGFGPSNFLVGMPKFDFEVYRPWIDARFEPRRFAQLEQKMGSNVKYAIGAFLQALEQNPELESILQDLGTQAHVYVGTGLGDMPLEYEVAVQYHHAQQRWDRFWCQEEHHPQLAAYRRSDPEERRRIREDMHLPEDPADLDPEDPRHDQVREEWFSAWLPHSEGLNEYLGELREIESQNIGEDVESSKRAMIRRKLGARKRLNKRFGCPPEPWTSVDAKLLWNIANIPAAQISMLAGITGPAIAPVAACSTFGIALKMAENAIRLGQAKVAVVGATDPPPHPLVVAGFYNARVLSHDSEVSKPLTGMRGTHVAGGSCIWIVGDADYLMERGLEPLGLEILGIGVSSDADHIITPSEEGPRIAMRQAFHEAGVEASAIRSWDMHATATPGDWTELLNALSVLPDARAITARKGTFGHGMSVCGGWEMTAQHLGVARGALHPVHVSEDELHPMIQPHMHRLVRDEPVETEGDTAGKISMGIGGINCCIVGRRWDTGPNREENGGGD